MQIGGANAHLNEFTPRAEFEQFKSEIRDEVVARERIALQGNTPLWDRVKALESKAPESAEPKTPTWVKVAVPVTAAVGATGFGLAAYNIANPPPPEAKNYIG